MARSCKTCMLCNKQKSICLLNGATVKMEIDDCSKHSKYLDYCDICRSPVLPDGLVIEEDENGELHTICGRCNQALSTCQSCKQFQICPFETDPNPLPKVVMKTIRQGNMMMQTQIKNEERVKALCHTCGCWSEECGCMKEFNVGCDKKSNFWTSRNP